MPFMMPEQDEWADIDERERELKQFKPFRLCQCGHIDSDHAGRSCNKCDCGGYVDVAAMWR